MKSLLQSFLRIFTLLFTQMLLPSNLSAKIQLEAGYSTGKYIFIKDDYAELGLIAPIYLNNWSPFIDILGYRFNNSRWGSSIGVGVRSNPNQANIFGLNIYHDYRQGHYHGNFQQLGLGLEWLNRHFDMRVNGYIPFGKKTSHSKLHSFNNYKGDYFATCRTSEYALTGFDIEMGHSLLSRNEFEIYGAVGSYYYHKSHQKNLWGGCARVNLNWNRLITLQARTSYDRDHHTEVQGQFIVRLPLDMIFSGYSCNEWFEPVQRNGIISTDHCCKYTWNW